MRRAMAWGLGVGILVSLGVLGGFYGGTQTATQVERKRSEHIEAQATRIIALVIERNPRATIKDFVGFPEILFRAAADADVDYRLLLAMIDKESGFRPDAVGASGEIGLMQILPATGAALARESGITFVPPTPARKHTTTRYDDLGTLGDVSANLTLGVAYLRRQLARYALLPVALRAYNRHPDRAREHRPEDRYAEDIALDYLVKIQRLPHRVGAAR